MKRKAKRFGALTDDPRDILDVAHEELKDRRTRYGVRQAAEKAHLAMSSAVEVAANRNLTSYNDELKTLSRISKQLKDPQLETEFKNLRRELHQECFHQDRCQTPEKMFESFGKARFVIDRVLASRRRGKK